MDMKFIIVFLTICSLSLLVNVKGKMSIDEMWKILADGDSQREKKHLPIDGIDNDGEIKKRETVKEHDILLDTTRDHFRKRDATLSAQFDWHMRIWRTRVIPYTFDNVFLGAEHQVILDSMKKINDKTCLIFRTKLSSDNNWLRFYKGAGCFSGIGRKYYSTAASTDISLGTNCIHESIIIHEILHALGFPHEQSRVDRDSYVTVYLNRVQSSMTTNFDKALYDDYNHGGTPYDVKSIMQYSRNAFTRDYTLGPTMEYKFDQNMELGDTELSDIDVQELNNVYQCQKNSGWSDWSEWSSCRQRKWGTRDCSRAKVRFCISNHCYGQDRFGVEEKVELCTLEQCANQPVDGHWGQWSDYTPCSGNCGWGVQTKYRKCNNPVPRYGGKLCEGSITERFLCRNSRCSGYESPLDENFNQDITNWKEKGFTTRSGSGTKYNVGPKRDVSGNGKYAVLSASTNTIGKLESPLMKAHPNGKKCLTFFYQLNGRSFPTNALSVYTEDTNKNYVNFPSFHGHQGNYWQRKAITIGAKSNAYKIIIEGRVNSNQNEVAIDDIFIDEGQCAQGLEGYSKDLSKDCEEMAINEKCNKDTSKRNMHEKCRETCSKCDNRHTLCETWAIRGECTKNVWMLWNCCLACNKVCFDTSVSSMCKDNADYTAKCPQWASRGECTKNQIWMAKNCYKSCYRVLSQ